ncbi:DNA topoisomerase [Pelomyxa schiedti]|nr:DNA topoisomerase [Pelomyxa schiedti]
MESDFTDEFRKWSSCDPSALFSAPVIKYVPESNNDLKRTLQEQARRCDWLVLWLDCDREGENIAMEVVQVCHEANRRIEVFRAHFSSLVGQEIRNACNKLTSPDEKASAAVDARQEVDLRIGAAFTRFQTKRLQNSFAGLPSSVISYGPCQFPTLGFVVDRYWQIQNFIEETFWSIHMSVTRTATSDGDGNATGSGKQVAEFLWSRVRLFDHAACVTIYEDCVRCGVAVVMNMESKPKSKWRPLPLTTVELQKQVSRKLHISSEKAMKIAEELYQKGFISYPRTETSKFPDGFDFNSLLQQQSTAQHWGAYSSQLLDGEFRHPRAGQGDDHAHPPIHPTKSGDSLSGEEARVYEFITRHFLACCSDDAQGVETSIVVELAGEQFHCEGLAVLKPNYLAVYPYEKWVDKSLPVFHSGERFIPDTLEMKESKTSAPKLLTESELIALMDKNGIGTDATIATHIQTIQERGYAEMCQDGRFAPTNLGVALIEGYDSMGFDFSRPMLRAEMEADMLRISSGERTKSDVIHDCVGRYAKLFDRAVALAHKLDEAMGKYFDSSSSEMNVVVAKFVMCGKCASPTSLLSGEGGNYTKRAIHCAKCKIDLPCPSNGELSPHEAKCPLCQFQVVSVTKQDGNLWQFCPWCRNHPPAGCTSGSNGFPCFQCSESTCKLAGKKAPVGKCPQCPSGNIQLKTTKDGVFYLGCTQYPTCKASLWLPRAIANATVTNAENVCHGGSTSAAAAHPPVQRLDITYHKNHIPPGVPVHSVACVAGCDGVLNTKAYSSGTSPSTSSNSTSTSSSCSRDEPYQLDNSADTSVSDISVLDISAADLSALDDSAFAFDQGADDQVPVDNDDNYGADTHNSNTGNSCAASHQIWVAPTASHADNDDSSDAPMCPLHQLPCIKRVTQKEGKNKGREFWRCEDQACSTFIWADEAASGVPISGRTPYSSNGNGGGSGSGRGGPLLCYNCNQPGHFASACPEKSSGGRGRGYQNSSSASYSYSRGRGRGSGSSSSSSSYGKSNNNRRWNGNNSSTDDSPLVPAKRSSEDRKCSVCHSTGHDKRSCKKAKW